MLLQYHFLLKHLPLGKGCRYLINRLILPSDTRLILQQLSNKFQISPLAAMQAMALSYADTVHQSNEVAHG
jgi:hypothetical protein